MFEKDEFKLPGTRRGTWVLRIDGKRRPPLDKTRAFPTVFLPRWVWKVFRKPNTTPVEAPKPPKRGAKERSPRVLDLFSGTESVGRVFREEGFRVVSVDINQRIKPTIIADILEWDYAAAFPPGYFDVLFACPPCEQFSRARTNKPKNLASVEDMVLRTLKIIKYLKPSMWFMENPR